MDVYRPDGIRRATWISDCGLGLGTRKVNFFHIAGHDSNPQVVLLVVDRVRERTSSYFSVFGFCRLGLGVNFCNLFKGIGVVQKEKNICRLTFHSEAIQPLRLVV